MKVPFLVGLQCRKCALQWLKLCTAYGGVQPPMWTVTLRFIRTCGTFMHEADIGEAFSKYAKSPQPKTLTKQDLDWMGKDEEKGLTTREIRHRLQYAQRRPQPKPSPKHFKPKTAYEKRLYKEKAKPEED